MLRVDQLAPLARASARLHHLAASAAVPQQHLAGADGGAGHVREHVAVADVLAFATASPRRLQQLHVQPGVRASDRLLGQGRDPGRLALLLEGLLHVRQALLGQIGVPAAVRRLAEIARLRVNASVPVQPDQAVGVGRDRRAVRARAAVQASGDSVRVEDAALLEPVPESPQLDLSADPADVWKLRAYLVQQGLLAHRRRSADLVALRNPSFDHALDRRLLHDPRVPHASAQAGGVVAVAASRGALSVLRLPGGRTRAERAPGAGGAHAAAAGALPGVPGYRENLIGRLNPAFVYKRVKKGALNTPLYTNRVARAALRAADRAVHEPGDTELRSRQGPELQ